MSLNPPVGTRPAVVDARPLFLLGIPRSGTTFLQQVVNAHPEIIVTDELRVVSWLVRETQRLREGYPVHGTPYPFNHGADFADYLLNNARWILAAFYRSQARRAGKPAVRYWGDKYPHYDEVLHLIPALFPRAHFVVIHRDLRDVVCSLNNGHKWTSDRAAPYACFIFDRLMHKIDALVAEGTVPPGNFIHVDYLDFHTRAREEAGRIFAALGLDYPPEVAEQVSALRDIQAHSIRKPGNQPTRFNIDRSQSRWERELSAEDLDLVLREIAKVAEAVAIGNRLKPGAPFVYPPPAHPEPPPAAAPGGGETGEPPGEAPHGSHL